MSKGLLHRGLFISGVETCPEMFPSVFLVKEELKLSSCNRIKADFVQLFGVIWSKLLTFAVAENEQVLHFQMMPETSKSSVQTV